MRSSLEAGVGRTDITPELGTRLMGYPIEDRVAEAIHDPLHCTALVLSADETKAAIVSLDTTILDDDVVAAIRHIVQDRAGLAGERVTVCAIQTHSAPATQTCYGWGDKDEAYVADLLPKVADAVLEADATRRPVRLGIGTTQSDVGVNRREILPDHSVALGMNPWGPYDPTLTALRLEGQNGPVAVLVHYGAHPTSLGHAGIVTRDWPGVMVDHVERLVGAPALFMNGAVGDVGPRLSSGRTTGAGIQSVMEVGWRAATDAARALNTIKEFRDVRLSVMSDDILLPYRPLPALDDARERLEGAEPHRDQWGAPMCNYLYWQSVVEAHRHSRKEGKAYRQTLTAIGPVALVPLPGEAFAEIVLRIRRDSPFPYTLCASTSNGSNGYFATRESLHRGGYEVWVGKAFGAYLLAENIDDVLVQANLALLERLAGCSAHVGVEA